METYFFDTNGHLWMTCNAEHDGAEAFGPTGVAVQIDVAHRRGETPWSEATRLGLVIRGGDGEWDTLVDGGLNAGNGEDPCCTFNAAAATPVRGSVIIRAAYLVVGGVYGSAGNCRVEVRQNRATHEVPNYEASELHITIISGDAEACDEDGCRESAVCTASEWRFALGGAMSA